MTTQAPLPPLPYPRPQRSETLPARRRVTLRVPVPDLRKRGTWIRLGCVVAAGTIVLIVASALMQRRVFERELRIASALERLGGSVQWGQPENSYPQLVAMDFRGSIGMRERDLLDMIPYAEKKRLHLSQVTIGREQLLSPILAELPPSRVLRVESASVGPRAVNAILIGNRYQQIVFHNCEVAPEAKEVLANFAPQRVQYTASR